MFVLQRHKVLLRLISCSCAGLKEMKTVGHYFSQVGLGDSDEAGNVKKKKYHPYNLFSNHKYISFHVQIINISHFF